MLTTALESYLRARATIVQSRALEAGIVERQGKYNSELTCTETAALLRLKLLPSTIQHPSPKKNSTLIAEKVVKQMQNRDKGKSEKSKFIGLHFIFATSNVCERLISKPWYTVGDCRRAISYQNFETQLHPHINTQYWGIDDVPAVVQ